MSMLTWLSKLFDSLQHISTVTLTRNNEINMLEGFGDDKNRVALGS